MKHTLKYVYINQGLRSLEDLDFIHIFVFPSKIRIKFGSGLITIIKEYYHQGLRELFHRYVIKYGQKSESLDDFFMMLDGHEEYIIINQIKIQDQNNDQSVASILLTELNQLFKVDFKEKIEEFLRLCTLGDFNNFSPRTNDK